MEQRLVLKGNIVYAPQPGKLVCAENSYLLTRAGLVEDILPQLPMEWAASPLHDYGEMLIIPGFSDLHLHAPQYAYAGLGMDLELLNWLEQRAYPEESRYAEAAYAAYAYGEFTADLRRSFTCRANIFATVHNDGAEILAGQLAETGLIAYVGKLSMDRNCPPELAEQAGGLAAAAFVLALQGRYARVKPIITPRFLPACSSQLLAALGKLVGQYELPVQSHLAENLAEVNWVRKLEPKSDNYADAYDRYGLLEGHPTVMAHCIYLSTAEQRLLKERNVYVAHCPQSNMNLCSGVAPVRQMLEAGLKIGLGTDVAGGAHLSMLRAIQDTVAASKLRRTLSEPTETPLTVAEAFYLATKGGGGFFGQTGSFEAGYECDALVLDDGNLHPAGLSLEQRLQRAIYLAESQNLHAKYVAGQLIDLS